MFILSIEYIILFNDLLYINILNKYNYNRDKSIIKSNVYFLNNQMLSLFDHSCLLAVVQCMKDMLSFFDFCFDHSSFVKTYDFHSSNTTKTSNVSHCIHHKIQLSYHNKVWFYTHTHNGTSKLVFLNINQQ